MEDSGDLPACYMLALHDVDLLPIDPELNYEHISLAPYHLIPHWLHPIYNYYTAYMGGAILIARRSFERVNGFSNIFWGWGREDDEFGLRLKRGKLTVSFNHLEDVDCRRRNRVNLVRPNWLNVI